jgi:hypothetical protein
MVCILYKTSLIIKKGIQLSKSDNLMNSISTRLEEKIIKEIEKLAKEMNLERSAFVRKFILDGYQNAILRKALELVQRGELSIEQGAYEAGVSIYRFVEAAREMNFEISLDASTIKYEAEVLRQKLTN